MDRLIKNIYPTVYDQITMYILFEALSMIKAM